MGDKTTFLIAKNDFISGVSRIFDIASTRNKRVYNTSQSDDVTDKKGSRYYSCFLFFLSLFLNRHHIVLL
ncbi:hypothetical protein [Granulicatella elegans]|uniref:hypothetical protein n=1 Tax=Granulicatella elegans TaxID=137732 RepID=UPI000A4C23EC|nr:hypothetical protein [Granulicatella elegans]UEA30734.1 hypothetical protein LK443_05380 [Granulicatella elegans]